MSVELRLPNITGVTEREQLAQIKSYLQQFVPQLQWALSAIDTSPTQNYTVLNDRTHKSQSTPSVQPDTNVLFSELKPFIIKSADIVQAYYEEINSRLESIYVAESYFGTFVEQSGQDIKQNATNIEQLFTNNQQIIADIENLDYTLSNVNARIKSGLLYHDNDGLPVYGLEIGQRTTTEGEEIFNKYARFTSDRLSFYDQNGREVAYVSDYKLFIRSVEITSTYKIGGFEDTVMDNGDIVTKWVGGNA